MHKTTSISVIDAKFHKKNPLLRLRDFQFFQTAVTNLIYRYCQPFVQSLVTSSPSSRTKPQLTVQCAREKRLSYCQLRHPTSLAHWIGHRTVQIQSNGLRDLGHSLGTSLPLPDRPSERTTDWTEASLWSEHYWQSSESMA